MPHFDRVALIVIQPDILLDPETHLLGVIVFGSLVELVVLHPFDYPVRVEGARLDRYRLGGGTYPGVILRPLGRAGFPGIVIVVDDAVPGRGGLDTGLVPHGFWALHAQREFDPSKRGGMVDIGRVRDGIDPEDEIDLLEMVHEGQVHLPVIFDPCP